MTQVLAIADVERDKWVIIWQVAEEITAEVGDGTSTPETDRYRRKCIARIRKTINRARFLVVFRSFVLFHDFGCWHLDGGGKLTLMTRIVFYYLNGKQD